MSENASTCISNSFLNKYLSTAPTSYIVVFLCVQKFIQEGNTSFTSADVAECLNMTESDVRRAMEFWEKNGESILRPKTENTVSAAHIPSSAPEYTAEEMNYYLKTNDDFRSLLESAQSNLGKMLTTAEIKTLYSFHDWLRLPLEVIEMLLVYCCDNGHRSMRYIEKVAITWADDGVKDEASALAHIRNYNNVYMRIMNALGLGSKTPVAKQIEYMKKWTSSMPVDLILYGCEKTALIVSSGNPFPYADKIFANWKKDNIDTLLKAKEADEKFAAKRGARKKEEQPTVKSQKTVQKKEFNYDQRNWDFDTLQRLKREELKRNLEG